MYTLHFAVLIEREQLKVKLIMGYEFANSIQIKTKQRPLSKHWIMIHSHGKCLCKKTQTIINLFLYNEKLALSLAHHLVLADIYHNDS